MPGLEAAVFVLVFLILVSYGRHGASPAQAFRDFLFLAASAWALEESAILFYGYYAYRPVWNLFLDKVPAAVVAVWPVVILSARELAREMAWGRRRAGAAVLGGLVVLADAALIEPLAVEAGLWSWKGEGLFGVPLIGIFGWAFFAVLAILTLETRAGARVTKGTALALGIAPFVGVHLLLTASWWGLFRWVEAPIHPLAVTCCAWVGSLFLTGGILARRMGSRMRRGVLLRRLPAAGLLFSLFWCMEAAPMPLAAYAVAFVPPYLALMAQQYVPDIQRRWSRP
jgi:hypothetical protein